MNDAVKTTANNKKDQRQRISAISFVSKGGKILWEKDLLEGSGEWINRSIDEGHKVIGFQVNFSVHKFINAMGFILGTKK